MSGLECLVCVYARERGREGGWEREGERKREREREERREKRGGGKKNERWDGETKLKQP